MRLRNIGQVCQWAIRPHFQRRVPTFAHVFFNGHTAERKFVILFTVSVFLKNNNKRIDLDQKKERVQLLKYGFVDFFV